MSFLSRIAARRSTPRITKSAPGATQNPTIRPARTLSSRDVFVRNALVSLAVVALALIGHVTLVSGVQHLASQQKVGNAFRELLAAGTAPTSEGDFNQVLLSNGEPVAILRIPSIGVNEVVLEGTDATTLKQGAGHRRDTVLPGQAGTSVIMGRAWSYGGPFNRIGELQPGATITAITGQGFHTYKVEGVRRAGDAAPARPGPGQSRITLESAHGLIPFSADGLVRVDAIMTDTSLVGDGLITYTAGGGVQSDAQGQAAGATDAATPGMSATDTASPSATASSPASAAQATVAPSATATSSATPSATPGATGTPGATESATGAATPAAGGTATAGQVSANDTPSTKAFAAGVRATSYRNLSAAQLELGVDFGNLWPLLFALQALIVLQFFTFWSLRRFGLARTWIVAGPMLLLATLSVADLLANLLPNLI